MQVQFLIQIAATARRPHRAHAGRAPRAPRAPELRRVPDRDERRGRDLHQRRPRAVARRRRDLHAAQQLARLRQHRRRGRAADLGLERRRLARGRGVRRCHEGFKVGFKHRGDGASTARSSADHRRCSTTARPSTSAAGRTRRSSSRSPSTSAQGLSRRDRARRRRLPARRPRARSSPAASTTATGSSAPSLDAGQDPAVTARLGGERDDDAALTGDHEAIVRMVEESIGRALEPGEVVITGSIVPPTPMRRRRALGGRDRAAWETSVRDIGRGLRWHCTRTARWASTGRSGSASTGCARSAWPGSRRSWRRRTWARCCAST